MCGLVGFIPKKGKSIDLNILIPLAIANEERGTTSCGYAIGSLVNKGIGKLEKARDLLAQDIKTLRDLDMKDQYVIFHTRRSTVGAATEDNAHPFSFENEENYLIGAHNGVIRNTDDLFKRHLKTTERQWNNVTVDSKLLYECIYTKGFQEILQEYTGDAALLFFTKDKFYAFKGESNYTEERPLFMAESKDGFWFHSIESVLKLYFDNVVDLKTNTVYEFSRGKLIQEIPIERKKIIATLPATTFEEHFNCYLSIGARFLRQATGGLYAFVSGEFYYNENFPNMLSLTKCSDQYKKIIRFQKGYIMNDFNKKLVNKLYATNTLPEIKRFISSNKALIKKYFKDYIPFEGKSDLLIALYDIEADHLYTSEFSLENLSVPSIHTPHYFLKSDGKTVEIIKRSSKA